MNPTITPRCTPIPKIADVLLIDDEELILRALSRGASRGSREIKKIRPGPKTTLIEFALDAGAAIMNIYARDFTVAEKADASPVTDADAAAWDWTVKLDRMLAAKALKIRTVGD